MDYDEIDERFFAIDEHGVLRIPTALWLALLIQVRHWALMLVTLASLVVGVSTPLNLDTDLPVVWMAVLQGPTLLVLVAAGWRQPAAHRWAREVWSVGHVLMGLTALCNSLWVAWWLYSTPGWSRWPELYLASTALLDIAMAHWAISQPLPRKVFSEFPAPVKP